MGSGDWGLGNPQSPIPNPQSPFNDKYICNYYIINMNNIRKIIIAI